MLTKLHVVFTYSLVNDQERAERAFDHALLHVNAQVVNSSRARVTRLESSLGSVSAPLEREKGKEKAKSDLTHSYQRAESAFRGQ